MAQKEGQGAAPRGTAVPATPGETAKMAEERVKEMAGMQKEMLAVITEMNQRWLSFVSAQATLASGLASKLAGARALPDVAAVYQEWMTQQSKMITEQNERFLADSRKMMEAMAQGFPRAWNGGST
jgi:hypothetical protein